MITNVQRTAAWLHACGKARNAANLSVQIGCDFEEQAEFLECLSINDPVLMGDLQGVIEQLKFIGKELKAGRAKARFPVDQRANALDALCDREVTGNGIAYLAHFDKEEADRLVLDANDAKLVDGKPVLLPGGKIGKPDGWKPADLTPFV